MNNTVPVAAGGPDESVSEESDGMVRKAPQGQSLALSEVMQPAATTKQLCESPKDIEAPSMTILVVGEEVQPTAQKCGGVGGQRHSDAHALFARFATLSTLSTAVAPEHGNLNRLIRSGSHPTLDEPEAPTLDATGLRHVLRGVGLGVPNSTSVRPMLAEFGEVVGCQPRLTYAQFLTLRAALNAFGDSALSISTWRAGRARHRALFTRFATLSTLNPGAESLQPGRSSGFNNDCFHGKHCF